MNSFQKIIAGVYIIVAMGLTCVSVTFAVAISYLYHQSVMGREVPNYLRKIGLYLNRILKVRPHMRGENTKPPPNKKPSTTETTPDLKTPLRESFSSINFTFRSETEVFDFENVHFGQEGGVARDAIGRKNPANKKRGETHRTMSSSEELIRRLDILLAKQEEQMRRQSENKPQLNKEWQEIAEVIDRTLFWVYTMVTTSITVIILVLVPLGKTVSL